jgi:hypothetical protein
VELASPKRPSVRIVVLDDASGAPVVAKTEDIPSAAVDIVEQLNHAGKTVESRLQGLKVDRVVIRRADFSKKVRNTEGPRIRLLVEGAATAAARNVTEDTRLATGKDIADGCSMKKDELDDEAKQLIASANEHKKYADAAAAALAGLRTP